MQELRDIRSLEEIPDISFYLFIIMIGVGVVILVGVAIMIMRYFKRHNEDMRRKEVLKRLENIDFSDSKKAAYLITRYARFLATEERSQKLYKQLEKKLYKYKYRPNPPAFDQDTIGEYHIFLEVVDG